MKASRQDKPFVPVILTLETQQEVDALALIFNHSFIMGEVGLEDVSSSVLEGFYLQDPSGDNHMDFNSRLKKRFSK